MDSYEDAIRWLYDRIDYERIGPSGQTNPFRLERVERLLALIGSPQERIPAIHIAGTKGKGSTAAMIESILRTAGVQTGLFTSPHIEQFEERMRVSGRMPGPDQFARLVRRLREVLEDAEMDRSDRIPTFFEVSTILAWMLFDEENVSLAVLETGMGGRLDCTNVCRPLVTVITSIGLDHTHILGDTLSRIATEKAGIIKPGVPVIQGQLPGDADLVVEARAREMQATRFVCGREFAWLQEPPSASDNGRQQRVTVITPRSRYDRLTLPLLGQHQAHNASLAVMAVELLTDQGGPVVPSTAIESGLQDVSWPLRFEVFDGTPTIILDAAHNPDSMRAVADTLTADEWQKRKRVLVFAASADKDAAAMLRYILPHFDDIVFTRFLGNPRSLPPENLCDLARTTNLVDSARLHVTQSPADALEFARHLAGAAGLVCATGSLFLAAEIRGLLAASVR